jgi:hypothetical protein
LCDEVERLQDGIFNYGAGSLIEDEERDILGSVLKNAGNPPPFYPVFYLIGN